jgi:hypothetical protein
MVQPIILLKTQQFLQELIVQQQPMEFLLVEQPLDLPEIIMIITQSRITLLIKLMLDLVPLAHQAIWMA